MLAIYLQMLETEDDKVTFEALYHTYREMMMGIAVPIVKSQSDAEDAVHQAFLAIIDYFHKISKMKRPDLEAYIVVIVRNKSIDILRARKKIADFDYNDSIGEQEYPEPQTSELADKLAKLPEKYRSVLLLRFHYGFKTKELAKMYGTTQENIQKMLWRGRKMLEDELNGEEKE